MIDKRMPYQYSVDPNAKPTLNLNVLHLMAAICDRSVLWHWSVMMDKTRIEWSRKIYLYHHMNRYPN